MLRRTLILFFGFVLLVLVITVGYALLGLSGPRTAIADADRALADDRVAEAVRLLDIAERTLTAADQTELLPDILRRRYRAHHKLGNVPAARHDIEALLAHTGGKPDDSEIAVEHIEIMLDDQQPEAALAAARSLLENVTGAEQARTLELAGEAHQAIYRRHIRALVQTLDGVLGEGSRERAATLLKTLLYRDGDDPVAVRAQSELFALMRRESATAVSLDTWQGRIDEIRAGIQQALAHFRKSLIDPDGKPVAAFQGLAFALEQAGRTDDRRALQDLYLRRFDHLETVYAAVATADERLAAGDDRAVVAIAERYLPPGKAVERARADRFPTITKRLMLAQARALRRLGDRARLDALMSEVQALHDAGLVRMLPEYFAVLACLNWNEGQQFPELLTNIASIQQDLPATDGYDIRQIALDLLAEWVAEKGDSPALSKALDVWCQTDANDLRARRMRCVHLLAAGQPNLAMADAAVLVQHRTHDDAALALYVRAVDEAAKATNRDASQLLARQVARRSANPTEPHDPAIYLALGELAMTNKLYQLAARCGQLATPAFPWAEWPRRLEAEAKLAMGDAIDALRAAETYREFHPDSTTALRLYMRALGLAKREDSSLLFDAALHRVATTEMAQTLLAAAIARDQRALLPPLCRRAMYRYNTSAPVMLRSAVGLLAAGQTAEARNVLLNIPVAFPGDHEACVEATTRFLPLEAKADPKSPLLGMAVRTLVLHAHDDPEILLRVAQELEANGQPSLVLDVLSPLLEDEANVEGRNGRVFALAGRACLALDRLAQAEVYFTGAISFDDGRLEALPSLSLLWLLQKRTSDAESALWQTEATDEASACLLASLGRLEPAVAWARVRVRQAPLDVPAMLLLALGGNADDKRTVPADFKALVHKDSPAVLRVLTLLSMPGFQVMAEKAASDLHERVPTSTLTWFLYARALAASGKRDRAVAELTELTQKVPTFMPAYDEVLRITDGGLHGDISKIGPLISNSVVMAPLLATPRMRAMVGEAFATQVSILKNNPEHALPVLARLWIQFPQESRAGLENVGMLTTRGRTDDAFELLRQLEGQLPDSERSRFLDFYFMLGRALVRNGEAKIVPELEAKARRVVEAGEPYGAAVHFLVDRLETAHGPFVARGERAPHAAEAETLLLKHLDFFPSLRDLNVDLCLRSVERLEQIEGADEVLRRIDDLLRHDPTLLPVWIRRAQLLEARGDVDQALSSLRWVADYIPHPPALLEFARIAAQHDRLSAADVKLVDSETTPELMSSPAAAYAMGLVAMRRGKLDEAARLLRTAAPRADGSHLYFAGMTALWNGDYADARDLFAELTQAYPDSPHSTYAGHLAAQLEQLQH
ncbi:MAG: hypothetical protein R3F56_14205 [Planctomycetota bacterium]